MKKFITLMFLFLMSVFPASTAIASESNSITISHIKNSKNQAISGWNIALYEIAAYDSETLSYSVEESYKGLIDTAFITEEKTANEISNKALELQDHIRETGITATASASSDTEGKVFFEDLKDGIYIIIFSERDDYDASPSLVSVPGYESSSVSIEAKIEDSKGNGGGGGNTPDNDSPSSPDHFEYEKGNVLGAGRDLPIPEKKMVLGAGRTPQTGDESRMQLYLYLTAASVLILISWMIIWLKKARR
ncbi:sortase B protein-sorting domain-containing protein [Oribacterium sp. P6A1]|uniref:sortase B protein-sorting domain-containing protein n=1 Tax=Oribacterium sp. P6A1 TaxID=1410612 RepID=UPI00056D807F|nr:sortase B protein-sorting domain-containing protein [Oribacterium sp. P6A1]